MSATGELLYLPVLSPMRSPFPSSNPKRMKASDQQQARQPRFHRLPRPDHQRMAYGANAQVNLLNTRGRLIDIYV